MFVVAEARRVLSEPPDSPNFSQEQYDSELSALKSTAPTTPTANFQSSMQQSIEENDFKAAIVLLTQHTQLLTQRTQYQDTVNESLRNAISNLSKDLTVQQKRTESFRRALIGTLKVVVQQKKEVDELRIRTNGLVQEYNDSLVISEKKAMRKIALGHMFEKCDKPSTVPRCHQSSGNQPGTLD